MANLRVVIPVFNGQKYIGSALDSVLSQNYDDYEVIVADDGSSDSTAEIVSRYINQDPRIRYLKLPHRGVSETRNSAIEVPGSFQYVAFLDADDVWVSSHLNRGVSVLDETLDADVYFSSVQVDVSESSWSPERANEYEKIVSTPRENFDKKISEGLYFLKSRRCRRGLLLGEFWIMPSTVVLRRGAVSRWPWFRSDLVVSEDTEFFLNLAELGSNFIFDSDKRVIYRRHVDNASAPGGGLQKKSLAALEASLRFARHRRTVCETREEVLCIREQISDAAYLLALNHSERRENASARKYFMDSMKSKWSCRALKGLISTVLPNGVVKMIRKLRSDGTD